MKEIEKILEKTNAILKGHFLLTSGLHSDTYFEKFRIFQYPEYLEKIIKISKNLLKNFQFDYVAGPEKGGFFIAYEIARQFKKQAIYLEKSEDKFIIKRNFANVEKGKKILLVDDVLTTGKSLSLLIEDLNKDFKVEAVFVIIDRSEREINFNIPLIYLYKKEVKNYNPEECPLCKNNIPLIRPGSKSIQT